MSLPPPVPLTARVYQRGEIVGLGKTASWYYPYCVITAATWTCVGSTYDGVLSLSIPTEAQAEFHWPEWNQAADYADPATRPWGNKWKVRYQGLYYAPSCWLTSSQRGQPPSSSEAALGSRIHKDFQMYKDDKMNDVCTNQSHPIRSWHLLGSLEEDNEWNNEYSRAPDPITGEEKRVYVPASFIEDVPDPNKHGGDGDGYYREEYYPQYNQPVLYEADTRPRPPSQFIFGASTYVKAKGYDYQQQMQTEFPSWDIYSGRMSTWGILETSGYHLSNTNFYYDGRSASLWQQKVIWHDSRVKQTGPTSPPGGTFTRFLRYSQDRVVSSPMPADKVFFVCSNPGPGFTGYYDFGIPPPIVSTRLDGTPTYQSSPGFSSLIEKYKYFSQSLHPLTFTRQFYGYDENTVYINTEKWVSGTNTSGEPTRYRVPQSINWTVNYPKKTFQMGFNQLARWGFDKQGGQYEDNPAHVIGTGTFYEKFSGSELVGKTERYINYGNNSYLYSGQGYWQPD